MASSSSLDQSMMASSSSLDQSMMASSSSLDLLQDRSFSSPEAKTEIPTDLLHLILRPLPAKTLLRFRLVSKEWHALLSSEVFNADRPEVSYILHTFSNSWCYRSLVLAHKLSDENLRLQEASRLELFPSLNVDVIRKCWISSLDCRGLLCVVFEFEEGCEIGLWNPFTGECRRVSWPVGQMEGFDPEVFLGFGYDSVATDFKIVVFKSGCDFVSVMEMKSGVWRRVAALVPKNMTRTYGRMGWNEDGKRTAVDHRLDPVAVGNDIYWVAKKQRCPLENYVVLKFSWIDEELREVKLPQEIEWRRRRNTNIRLAHIDGSVCLFDYTFGCGTEGKDSKVGVWKYNAGDIASDWEEMVKITKIRGPLIPVAFTRNRDIVMKHETTLDIFVYVMQKAKVVKLKLDGKVMPKESLVCDVHFIDRETCIFP